MRTARKKVVGRGCYYHVCARIAGIKDDYLFTDVDKERGMQIVKEMSDLYFVDVISMCWMDNHWHIVLYTPDPKNKPNLENVIERYNEYYQGKKCLLNLNNEPERCAKVAEQLTDISFFMRQIHQKFTYYINRTHNRRGTLWAERFKSTILDSQEALWNCVKYIELNPLRAKMIKDPADYRFSTWGNYCGTGKHLFEENFIKHMKGSLGDFAKDWDSGAVFAEFKGEIARTICYETESDQDPLLAKEEGKQKEGMQLRFLRRTRHWSDGVIIGSKMFIQESALRLEENKRILKKKLSKGSDLNGNNIYCYKRLRL